MLAPIFKKLFLQEAADPLQQAICPLRLEMNQINIKQVNYLRPRCREPLPLSAEWPPLETLCRNHQLVVNAIS